MPTNTWSPERQWASFSAPTTVIQSTSSSPQSRPTPPVISPVAPEILQFLGPSSPWASTGTERPDQLPPNTCRYTGRANGLTTREPDERAGNCCQKR
ncbi:unnamed protein product [Tetraodon nigroviridis]|uniref:(spotted green pufferfish) hypothetical protein n=1 Tax=Tetraodon nigroviridis TaxID=99883 RepID=Q4RFJ4_TETNG|nr:unnamed protein product [Tetraodon nigroviridis]